MRLRVEDFFSDPRFAPESGGPSPDSRPPFSELQPISPIANALDMTNTPSVMHVDRALHISLTHIEILLISFD